MEKYSLNPVHVLLIWTLQKPRRLASASLPAEVQFFLLVQQFRVVKRSLHAGAGRPAGGFTAG